MRNETKKGCCGMPEKTTGKRNIEDEIKKRAVLVTSRGISDLAEGRLRTIMRHFQMSIFDYDIRTDTVYVRKEYMMLHDFTDYWFAEDGEYYYFENMTAHLGELIRKSRLEDTEKQWAKVRQNTSGEILSFDTSAVFRKGNTRWINLIADTLTDEDGKPVWVTGYCRDVHQERKDAARVQKVARTDLLTGFRNRSAGMGKICELIAENADTMYYIAVVDLNKFKNANDLFGHTFGDVILKEASECMEKTLPPGTIFCRTGGDEFLLSGPCEDAAEAMQMMTHLNRQMAHRVTYRGLDFDVSASIGLTVYPLHGRSLEELYDKADMAMYYAKKNGFVTPALYDETMDAIKLGKQS